MSGKSQRGGRGGGRGGSSSGGGRGGGSPKSPQNAAKELRLTGLVRSVVSGDSVVIMEINDKTKNVSVPTEFQLTLIGLKAPALGKRFMKDGQAVRVDDEAFAWDSRENLRKQLIGKVVVYRVEHELEFDSGALKRKFGEIWLDGKNIRFSIVEQGWAKANIRERKPKDGKPAPPPSKEDQDIQSAEAKAKAAKIGVWSDNTRNAVRKVKDRDDPSKPEEQFAFFEKFKGKPLPAIVEHVKSGSSYRIYLVETQDELTISLSGARSPIYKPKDPANSEEFGLEAKLYAEHVLLNRSVSVVLDGAEKFSFFATVTLGDPTFETSNFAIDLLQRGLAHYAKWSLSKKADTPLYEKAENKARDAKLKVHTVKKPNQQVVGQGGKPQKVVDQQPPPQKSVTGTVVEIVSAGSLVVRTSKGNQSNDQKFLISSIKVPQLPANKKEKKKKDEGKKSDESSEEEVDAIEKKQAEEKKQASFAAEQLKKAQEVTGKKTGNQKKNAPIIDPAEQKKAEGAWALEAKEFLRKTLIGKQVQCVWDYSVKGKGKGKQEGEVRDFYSVYLGNQSVGLLLVEQGFAWVMAHAENQSRAPEWKDMALAEKAAIAKNLRLHGVLAGFLHTAPVNRLLVNDLSENENYPMKGYQKQKEKKEAKDAAAKGGKKEEGKKVKGDAQKNRSFAEELKKAGRLPAVVEYVVSAGRFKLSIPSKGYLLTLGLSAIRCDAKVKVGDVQDSNIQRSYPVVEKDGKTPIYPNIGFHFARNALLQRDVQVEIEGTDVGGGFVGRLWLQVGNDLIDWSYQLLKEGHAALSGFVDRVITDNNVKTQYENAEKNAQDKKLNRWHNFDREEHEAKKKEQREGKNKGAEDEGDDEKPASFERVLITEIMSGSNFFYQSANPDTESALKDLESAFATGNFDNEPAYAPERREKDKEKEMVAGKFTVDGAWYRAHVLRWINKDVPEYEVRYIDYGNTEIVTKDNIRKLPDLLAKINGGKGLAQKARLAYINAPELDDDFGRDAAALFKELVWGKTMKASIRKGGRDQDVKNVSLGDEESLHISEELVKEGLAKVNRKGPKSKNPEKPTEYEVLKTTEAEAIKAHLNMWEYGELPDSEDERYHLNQLTR